MKGNKVINVADPTSVTYHEGTQIVFTVSIPESPLHFLRLLV